MRSAKRKRPRKTWTEKLRPDMQSKFVSARSGYGAMLAPTPMLIVEEIGRIPEGATISMAELRTRLAHAHHVHSACPLTTARFFHVVAGAAEEDLAAGRPPIAPWWRVIQPDMTLSAKTPPGPEVQAQRLAAEGHRAARDPRGRWLLLS